MELEERGRWLRDVRPHVVLHLFLGGFFLVGSAFVTWLSFVAKQDPRSSVLASLVADALFSSLLLVGGYMTWSTFRDAARLMRTRLTLFEGGFELRYANIQDDARSGETRHRARPPRRARRSPMNRLIAAVLGAGALLLVGCEQPIASAHREAATIELPATAAPSASPSIAPFASIAPSASADPSSNPPSSSLLDEQDCRWFLPGPTVGRARVRVAAPLYDDADGCPVAKPFCERGALLAGDDVVTTTTFGPFTCVTRGDVHGYVPTSALATLPALPTRSWIGTWLEDGTGPDRLVITSAPGGELDVVGHAEWHGWGDNVHIGDFHARGRPDAHGSMSIKDDDGLGCELGLRLVGRILLVEDNDGCGGTNVRFVSAFMTR